MVENQKPVYYGDYLELSKLLGTQNPKSLEAGDESHDETLFIIVHQVYELWFKQILHEMDSAIKIFEQPEIEERQLSTVNARLQRIIKIQHLLLTQLEVMETMTPMDFLEFRDLLIPASGFQSVQFREIEVKMGLHTGKRKSVDREYFVGRLSQKDRDRVEEVEKSSSLFDLLEKWLERIPFTNNPAFDFWAEYKVAVEKLMKADEDIIKKNLATLGPTQKEVQLDNLNATQKTFASLFDDKLHKELVASKKRRLSQKATLNGLFILLYRDEPILNMPYQILNSLMDIDENFTTWRYRHALMAHRLLGTKIGTGGSSGHHYLKMAAEHNQVYVDLFNLSTFLIPRRDLPKLPKEVLKTLNFYFNESE
ncbi:MAG: tryptophan 2,3-dioxygenase [Halobacteriovoraceae bacterium]|jgi:tryptophan 2,3-dioxygenase|nr:tryptophan 2,3-dioxygenase [Halobacteriovoraceae bacterium]MBT5093105.1 tryptophan 2,3-dioxygenase [Halobacteriovoraceae bacterium]